MGFVLGLAGKFFTSKFGAYSLIVMVVLFAGWRLDSHIKSVQKAADKAVSDKVEAELNGQILALKKAIKDQDDANSKAIQELKEANDATLHGLQADLDAANLKAAKVKIVTKEVTKYVTVKADSECTITTGFVWMHNVSIRENASLADSPPSTPDAATPFKISDVASTIRDNYAECEERAVIIEGWQKWYNESKVNFDKAVETEHVGVHWLSDTDWGHHLSYQVPSSGAELAAGGAEGRGSGQDSLAEVAWTIF